MNDTTDTLRLDRTDVTAFVAAVRAQLADLPAEEQQELTDGLEADLTDLVAERGEGALGDPLAYARELRTAAGLDPVMARRRGTGESLGQRTDRLLDGSRARWDRAVAGLPGNPWEFLSALRPVWWVARAWVATQLLDLVLGGYPHGLVPQLQGFGLVLLVVAVVVSVQIGRGRVWPGTRTERTGPRVVLLLLNVLALVLALPVYAEVISSVRSSDYGVSYADPGVQGPGMVVDGQFVENVYPYDATGHPLTGVQLFDQNGRPLQVTHDPGYVDATSQYLVRYPWQNGSTPAWNTYPLPERTQDVPDRAASAFTELNPPAIRPPLAAVSPVGLPGVVASVLQATPAASDAKPRHPATKSARQHKATAPTG